MRFAGTWSPDELEIAQRALAPLPAAWLESAQAIIRAPKLENAPAGAPGHSKYDPERRVIVVYDKGVYDRGKLDSEQLRRSIFHELAHAILQNDPSILPRWVDQTAGDGFVDEYAKTNSTEDFCDTFSEFLIFPQRSQRAVPRKWRFLYNLMQRSQEKTAMYKTYGFNDELQKIAAMSPGAKSGLRNLLSRIAGSRAAKVGATLGIGGISGAGLGISAGRKSGYERGTGDVEQVALEALQVGRQQGAQMGYQYAMQQMGKTAAPRNDFERTIEALKAENEAKINSSWIGRRMGDLAAKKSGINQAKTVSPRERTLNNIARDFDSVKGKPAPSWIESRMGDLNAKRNAAKRNNPQVSPRPQVPAANRQQQPMPGSGPSGGAKKSTRRKAPRQDQAFKSPEILTREIRTAPSRAASNFALSPSTESFANVNMPAPRPLGNSQFALNRPGGAVSSTVR